MAGICTDPAIPHNVITQDYSVFQGWLGTDDSSDSTNKNRKPLQCKCCGHHELFAFMIMLSFHMYMRYVGNTHCIAAGIQVCKLMCIVKGHCMFEFHYFNKYQKILSLF